VPRQWKQIARVLNEGGRPEDPYRTPRQCRERWLNKIDPRVD